MTNIVILGYFLIIVGIGVYSRFFIRTPRDFYIAGKKGNFFQISGSLLATILGGSATLGTIELSQQTGWAASWFLLCAALGLFILAPISKYVSRYGKYTLPGLLGLFYGKNAQLISSLIIPVAWLGIIAAQIIGAAKILHSVGLLEYKFAAILSGIVFILYTLIGGQKSILKTDAFQSVLILTGIIFLFILIRSKEIGTNPEVFNVNPVINSNFSVLDLIILILTYSTTFIAGPDIYSRIFCAKSEKTATYSILFVAILLIPFAFILTSVGISSGTFGNDAQSIGLISMGESFMPAWAFGLLIAALLSAVMSSADTTLLTASMIFSELIHGSLDKNQSYNSTRFSIVVIGLLSIVVSIFVTSIIQSLLLALAFFSGAFVIPVIAGLLKLKVNKKNVVAAILAGGMIALAGKIISIYFHELVGNLLIISSYLCNSILLFTSFSFYPFNSRS